MGIEFIKCHGSGNDFVMVDGSKEGIGFTADDFARFTRSICDRRGPVGADGTLFVLPGTTADVRMRIFNSDGSEAEMCGNGIRCVARLASEKLGQTVVTVETARGILECRRENNIFEGVDSYSVLIDNVSFISPDFPIGGGEMFFNRPIKRLSQTALFTFISLGNPHIVSFMEGKINGEELLAAGICANEDKELFPNGVNVTFFTLKDKQVIYTETYERGVGLTFACGTAMSACSIVACMDGLCETGKWIDVRNKGGMVKCLVSELSGKLNVRLLGNATFDYTANADFTEGKINLHPGKVFHGEETDAYSRFLDKCQ